MVMNAAQAWHVAQLYGDQPVVELFAEHGFLERGRRLAELVFAQADEGHRSDIEMSAEWARLLGLKQWVEWQDISGERCLGIELGIR